MKTLLIQDQIHAYHQDGYLLVENSFSNSTLVKTADFHMKSKIVIVFALLLVSVIG